VRARGTVLVKPTTCCFSFSRPPCIYPTDMYPTDTPTDIATPVVSRSLSRTPHITPCHSCQCLAVQCRSFPLPSLASRPSFGLTTRRTKHFKKDICKPVTTVRPGTRVWVGHRHKESILGLSFVPRTPELRAAAPTNGRQCKDGHGSLGLDVVAGARRNGPARPHWNSFAKLKQLSSQRATS
jgi:hypothetical protein